ncbi:MAG: DUF3883 domain-containing protein [Chloroflexi bacterium]|nr:DUF3883 domain-containing protein [Chloroflexota bacterium]
MDDFAGGEPGKAWTRWEIDAAVLAYLDMLQKERQGEAYVKASVTRELGAILPARTKGSIERKFQNISAILDEVGLPWIDGYKPLSNYQDELAVAVLDAIGGQRRLAEGLAVYGSAALIAPQGRRLATDDVLVAAPGARDRTANAPSRVGLVGGAVPAMRDFQTKPLGDAGEEWVVGLERERLERHGRADLASLVVWAAREIGDGLGYDVASFFPDGRERLIEVKTTNYGVRTPFYITRGEVSFSERRPEAFSLYRVHGFARDPRLYILDGSVRERAKLDPAVYLGIPL